jgi:hypothetical protein
MNPFAGADGRADGHDELQQIKNHCQYEVSNIGIGDALTAVQENRNSPPKRNTVEAKQTELRQQSLGAMPTYKISRLPVGNEKKQGGQQVDDGQGQPYHHHYQ